MKPSAQRRPPHARRRHDRALQVGVAGQRQRGFGFGAGRARPRALSRHSAATRASRSFSHSRVATSTWSLRLRPVWILRPASPRRSTRRASIAEWPSSNRSSSTKRAAAEVLGQRRRVRARARRVRRASRMPIALQAFGMRAAGLDVEQEELAVEDHVLAGEEALDARVDLDAGLLPQQVAHLPSCLRDATRVARVTTTCGMPVRVLVEAERQVEVLQRLRRRALEQVVLGRDHDQAAAVVAPA